MSFSSSALDNKDMAKTNQLIDEARKFVREFLFNNLPSTVVFHNYDHCAEVASICEELSQKEKLADEDRVPLLLAAWFMNTGYTKINDDPLTHSFSICRDFLAEKGVDEAIMRQIEDLYEFLKTRVEPTAPIYEIFHDAYWSFLGRKRFFRRIELLRLERERRTGKKFSAFDWNKEMFDLLLTSRFYTPTGRQKYNDRKSRNLVNQLEKLSSADKDTRRKKTGKDFGRGIDTVYRITLRNHIDLSTIADGKANMIISINTLLLSILITAGSASFSFSSFSMKDNLHILIPVLLLMLGSLTAIIFAVLSAIPNISSKNFDTGDVKNHRLSLLYFGNFLQLEKEEFVAYLRDLKTDQAILYDDLSRDLYNLGVVLQRKYRLLTIAYRAFVGGLVISFLAFLVVFFIV